MPFIKNIYAREILDSRGNPTVETEIILNCGIKACASVPSGASKGSYEALELRDNDPNRFHGKGVLKAINNVNKIIAPHLVNIDVRKQKEIDNIMIDLDGTFNKSNLGANAILSVSIAVCKAAAQYENIPLYKYLTKKKESLPTPMMNILNGGLHASFNIDFQEIMIVPSNNLEFKYQLQMGSEIFHSLKQVLKEKGHITSVGDEGGFAPNLSSNTEAFDLVLEAINKTKYVPGKDVFFAIDVAANELYDSEKNIYCLKKDNLYTNYKDLVDNFYLPLVRKYPIISIEDPLSEDDFEGWKYITKQLGNKIQIVGDDLFVTNKNRLKVGIDNNFANAILIKINQIGTISETLDTINLANNNHYNVIISHRSGETEDTFIADLAVGCNANYIKSGSLSRSERISKYNRLLKIEEEI